MQLRCSVNEPLVSCQEFKIIKNGKIINKVNSKNMLFDLAVNAHTIKNKNKQTNKQTNKKQTKYKTKNKTNKKEQEEKNSCLCGRTQIRLYEQEVMSTHT